MEFKEYYEPGVEKTLANLKSAHVAYEDYSQTHRSIPIICHDVIIRKDSSFLLVKRKRNPMLGSLWFVGGRILRGISTIDSLKEKTKEECGLDLDNIEFLGAARTFFEGDPFDHGKGTDTINLVYLADGIGNISLDELHEDYVLVNKNNYSEIKKKLDKYVIDYLDIAMNI